MPKCSAELEILICNLPTRQQLSEICVTQHGQILRTISQDGNKTVKWSKFTVLQISTSSSANSCSCDSVKYPAFRLKKFLPKFKSLSLLLSFLTKQSFKDDLPSFCKSALRFSSISSKRPNSEWTAGRNATLSPQICASHFASSSFCACVKYPAFRQKKLLPKFESLSLLLSFLTKQSFKDDLPSFCKSALRFSSISSKRLKSASTPGRNARLSPQICASHFASSSFCASVKYAAFRLKKFLPNFKFLSLLLLFV